MKFIKPKDRSESGNVEHKYKTKRMLLKIIWSPVNHILDQNFTGDIL